MDHPKPLRINPDNPIFHRQAPSPVSEISPGQKRLNDEQESEAPAQQDAAEHTPVPEEAPAHQQDTEEQQLPGPEEAPATS